MPSAIKKKTYIKSNPCEISESQSSEIKTGHCKEMGIRMALNSSIKTFDNKSQWKNVFKFCRKMIFNLVINSDYQLSVRVE